MKRFIAPTRALAGATILFVACICAPALAATPYTKVWTQQLGTTAHDRAEGLAADGNGHVYLSGYTGNALVPPHTGGWDMFLAQYDTSGAEQWTDQQGTSTHDLGHGLIADADGNTSLIGYTSAALGGPHIGGVDALTYRYDVAGNIEWSDQFGTTVEDAARDVTLDAAGNIYVTGYTHGSLGANNVGGEDAFLKKYDPNGNPLWTAQIGSTANERSTGVAIDGLGNIYIGGRTQGQIGAAHAGGWDAFLARFDAAGNHIWTQQFGTTADDMGYRIAADAADHIYVTGTTAGVLGAENAGGFDAFLRQFDPSGSEQWTVQFGTPDYDSGFGISTDALGRVYVTGDTEGALAGANAGGMDVFLTRYDAAGAEHWLTQFGSAGNDNSRLASVYSPGNVYVGGHTSGTLGAASAGGDDAFVARFSMPGDANGDGTVDVGDIAILGASWTGPGPGAGPNTWDQADFTADGWTDIGDFAVIGSNWSPGAGSSGGAEGVALNPSSRTVPAPPALILGSALLCGLALTRPR